MQHQWRLEPAIANVALLAISLASSSPAAGQEAETGSVFVIEAETVQDLVGVTHGAAQGLKQTGYFSLAAGLSLDQAIGWTGARIYLQGIVSAGGRPNDLAGTLQGVNNIEVATNRARLFEAYLEQEIPAIHGSLRLGFSDLNDEFYASDSASLLIGPAFGIGSELGATGPNGPSIFPSTAPMVRLKVEPGGGAYAQFAVVSAEAGVLGDTGGVPPLFKQGALLIAEAGLAGKAKLALGAWSYTRRQDDIRLTGPLGEPLPARARGIYLLAEQPIIRDKLVGFFRAGLSDGDTTPYSGAWQAGLLAKSLVRGRPDSQFSIGFNQAYLSNKYRANQPDAGKMLRAAETALEVTYSDKLAGWLTVQPDAAYVWNASRAAGSRNALVLTLRLRTGFSWP